MMHRMVSDESYIKSLPSYQHKLIKMRSELAILNHCAVPFLSRAATNLCWYYIIDYVQKRSLVLVQRTDSSSSSTNASLRGLKRVPRSDLE